MSDKRTEARRRRADNRNLHAPPGKHWCAMHDGGAGAYLPKDQFYKNKHKVHGLDNRCKDCAREYRRKHEKDYGRRSDHTKTVRVTNGVHALISKEADRREVLHPEYLAAAVRFYDQHGCKSGKCTNIGLKQFGGFCRDHWFYTPSKEKAS